MSLQVQEITFFCLLVSAICLLLATVVLLHAKGNKKKGHQRPPEPAGKWPIIGHLHLLGADKLLHRTLGDMADKYGPIFCLRLGLKKTVVISSWEVAKECFTTNDKVFATRPRSLAVKLMGYDHAMFVFAPYGPYWRDVRKLAVAELLSNSQQLEMLKYVRESEVDLLMKEINGEWARNKDKDSPVVVEMKEMFGNLLLKIMVRATAGKRCFGDEPKRGQNALDDFMLLAGLPMVSDAIPFLGWLDRVRGYTGEMKRIAKEVDRVVGIWVEEHRRNRLSGNLDGFQQDFLYAMLSVMDDKGYVQFSGYDPDTVIKATCLNLIMGGYETTSVTLTWALSLLLNNRRAIEKVQAELEIHVGKHRQVDGSDIKNLVYLQAIVKETLRLHPPGPLSVPHEAIEDCDVSGFRVQAGTRLLVNLWKMHRDPRIWSKPSEFQPERFLIDNASLDIKGRSYELLPFGSGRRICPGISFALEIMHLTLARLLHGFEFGLIANSLVDMTEGLGLTAPKVTPLEVTIVPRLPFELYGYEET